MSKVQIKDEYHSGDNAALLCLEDDRYQSVVPNGMSGSEESYKIAIYHNRSMQ